MYTDAPDQVLRLSMEGVEFALKISGAAAKNVAAALYAVARDQKRTKGKAGITAMLRQQRPLTVYTIPKADCPEFAKQAKRYGILYAPIPLKKGDDTLDLMVFQDDAPRVNRIVERLSLMVPDAASLQTGLEQAREGAGPFPERRERGSLSGSISGPGRSSERTGSDRPSVRKELEKLKSRGNPPQPQAKGGRAPR